MSYSLECFVVFITQASVVAGIYCVVSIESTSSCFSLLPIHSTQPACDVMSHLSRYFYTKIRKHTHDCPLCLLVVHCSLNSCAPLRCLIQNPSGSHLHEVLARLISRDGPAYVHRWLAYSGAGHLLNFSAMFGSHRTASLAPGAGVSRTSPTTYRHNEA